MKNVLITILCILLFTACKKKSPQTGTYYCVTLDSIPPMPNDSAASYHSDLTSSEIAFYVQQNTFTDTILINGVRYIKYQTTTCQFYQ